MGFQGKWKLISLELKDKIINAKKLKKTCTSNHNKADTQIIKNNSAKQN